MANLPWPEVTASQWHLVQQTKGQTLAEGNKTSGNKSQFEGLVDGAYCMSNVFSLLWQKSGGKGMGAAELLSAYLGYLRTPQLTRPSLHSFHHLSTLARNVLEGRRAHCMLMKLNYLLEKIISSCHCIRYVSSD